MCTLAAQATLGYKVVDTALTLLIAGIPILHRRVFNVGILLYDNLNNGSMQLIFVALRCCAALQVAYIRALVRHDKRTLELSRTLGINAEVCRQLHRATHTLRDIAE